ncbi:site-2 protease family protein [Adlercreutzia sp. ZJ141]|uniref:site-2 protease family protein n=1 Tax=Adlercreutzia sp. ZJ141 TaxID=2709406 RepID=UPI0013EBE2AF|nr:site-2 protease family protein [Adlercreutzia sp. ZJ141]
MSNNYLYIVVLQVLCFIPAIVFHEVAHGFAAYKLGDPTAKTAGRLSLNPAKHVDPFGTIIMPLMLMAIGGPVFGYAKPVPYNPRYFKDIRKGDMLVGMAGPVANLCMALVSALLLFIVAQFAPLGIPTGFSVISVLIDFFYLSIMLNLYLMFFNLIPLPPLDGSSLLLFFLPRKYLPQYYKVQQYAMPIFLVVVILVPYVFHVNPIGIYLDWTAGTLGSLLSGLAFL